MKKRIVSLLLVAALMIGFLPGALAFGDVTDTQMAARLELLQGFGVINGYPDGSFRPQNTITRAEFTKMIVTLLGGDKASEPFGAYTRFGDVPSTSWAARYINYAARSKEDGGLGLIKGYTDGSFRPENNINYAESVTILLRALGFTDADVGYTWPKNFIDKAASSGLSANVSRGQGENITRADAANLFYNALFIERKDGTKLVDSMYGETISSALILSVDAEGVRIAERPDDLFTNAAGLTSADVGTRKKLTLNEDGSSIMYAEDAKMQTSEKQDAFIYSTRTEDGLCYVSLDGVSEVLCLAAIDDGWVARSATLTIDNISGAIVKAELLESRNRTIAFAYYAGDRVTAVDGEVFTVPAATPTYTVEKGEMSAATAFSSVRDNLSYGDTLEFAIGADGTVKHVVARTGEAKVAVVEPGLSETQLRAALGAPKDAAIYKNGAETSFSALSEYDVAQYAPGGKVINVGSFRMSGAYTYAVPNSAAPEKITVFGNTLTLAPCAQESVSQFKPLSRMTLLFSPDGRVAGALEASNLRNVGVYSGGKVEFLGGPTLEMSLEDVSDGELVSVGCTTDGKPSASKVAERSTNLALDVEKMTMGDNPLAVGCAFFERAAKGQTPARITAEDISRSRITADEILHVSYDESGRANLIIFADVTGDRYEYGRVLLTSEERSVSGGTLTVVYDQRMIGLENSSGSSTTEVAQICQLPSGLKVSDANAYRRYYAWGGVATGTTTSVQGGGVTAVVGYKPLEYSVDADRTTFVGSSAVKIGGGQVAIAKDVQVYLEGTGVFMSDSDFGSALELVSAARAQGEKFELLLDAAPADGGKVRVIVVK